MPEIGVFTMVVLIVLIVSFSKVQAAKYRAERHRPADDPDALRMREEIRALRDRIAVLERIATENDRGVTLDREIERLRDRS